MAITALPTPPTRDDPDNFAVRADTFLAALPSFVTETNALAVDVTDKSAICTSAAQTVNVTAWVSGTTYAQGVNVYDTTDLLTYRRKVAGAGTTRPGLDSTNWALLTGFGDVRFDKIGPLAGLRNLVINGKFFINQRGYVSNTATTGANQYTLDRWRVVTSGQVVQIAGFGNGNIVEAPAGGLEQVVEGINIAGGNYVIGWSGFATCTVNGVSRAKGEVFALPAYTSATIRFSGGSVGEVQLEPGAVATPFEDIPYGLVLALCRRYYVFGTARWDGQVTAGTAFSTPVFFPVSMRVAPTVVQTNSTAAGFSSSPGIASVGADGFVSLRTASGTGPGQFVESWTASAEL